VEHTKRVAKGGTAKCSPLVPSLCDWAY